MKTIFSFWLLFITFAFKMNFTADELRRERKKIIDAAREIHDKAEKENRNLSDEEQHKYDELMDKQADYQARIERSEKQDAMEKTAANMVDNLHPDNNKPANDSKPSKVDNRRATPEFVNAFNRLLSGQKLDQNDLVVLNALQADSDDDGGFTVVSEQMINMLVKFIDDAVYIRQRATVMPLNKAESLGAPSLDADPEDGTWSGEIQQVDEDSAMKFGKRTLTPHLCSKLIKVSQKLVRVSALDIVTLISQRLAYKFGVTQEKAYLTGDGNNKPLGIFTASDNGVPTSRDISEDNTATAVTFDGLINAKFHLKAGYWRNADWIFHRDVIKTIAKLKDGDGQYLWRESVRAGEPDMLLGRPVLMSEFAPNTMTSGQYVGALGDFSHYWIVDAMDMAIQVLLELYAPNNQYGYIARYEGDGMPVLGEAFTRVKLG